MVSITCIYIMVHICNQKKYHLERESGSIGGFERRTLERWEGGKGKGNYVVPF